jgi:hypothetical protein
MSGLHRGNWSSTSNSNQNDSSQYPSNQSNYDRSDIHQTIHSTNTKREIQEYDRICRVDPTNRQLVEGFTRMVIDRMNGGWSCHLMTFPFSQLPGPRGAVIQAMKSELQRVYSTFLTRAHRRPRTASPDELPVLIGAADLSVYKRDRDSSPLVLCNEGLHFHAVLLVPPVTRLRLPVEEHFRARECMYLGKHRSIRTLDVRPVTEGHARVVDYVFKTVLRGRVSYDEGVLVLPRTRQELMSDRPLVMDQVPIFTR